ncbi:MAG: DNA recombination protein RmuC [Candidatus Moraniibacteriota bacterium]
MITILVTVLLILNIAILVLLFLRKSSDNSALIKESNERIGRALREEMSANRTEMTISSKETREEIAKSIKNFGDSVDRRIFTLTDVQNKNFSAFSDKLSEVIEKNDKRMEYVRETIEKRLENIQKDNSEKLEKMRETVDEKLHATLEKRLGESFKLVSERLELVHKGLGEMQTLASGVGDLKKVLQNVKTRGTWGEVQLGTLLDQIMTIEQYEKNIATKKDSNDRVEFAIKIPAKDEKLKNIWLPIDAKFPLEDFQNLINAEEKCDLALIASLGKALELRIKSEAKDIRDKYLDPPYTTDFGILFLPVEGLYAEVLRRPGLADTLQRDYKVIITGPTTIAAILNSLQMGFRTLAIEKRSSDVWITLGAIKKDFITFGDILDKTQKKLQEASNTIETASQKSRTIERKLSKFQELPVPEIIPELPLGVEEE